MVNDTVDLDAHREIQEQKSIEIRRLLQQHQENLVISKQRQNELENLLLATPARSWPDVATKAIYLLEEFASTLDLIDQRRLELVEQTIHDLGRLRNSSQGPS